MTDFRRTAEDKIEELAEKTNGKSFFVDDNDTSQGLNDAFIGSLTFQPAVSSDHIVVLVFIFFSFICKGGKVLISY